MYHHDSDVVVVIAVMCRGEEREGASVGREDPTMGEKIQRCSPQRCSRQQQLAKALSLTTTEYSSTTIIILGGIMYHRWYKLLKE